jgi:hypothetical protein
MADDVRRTERLDPETRLRLIAQLLGWTVEALPSTARALLEGEARETVDAALEAVRDAAAGSPPDIESDEVEDLEDQLDELADDDDLQDLGQLFVALSDCVGVPAEDVSVEFLRTIMSACYDVIRDCEDLPEFPVGTPEQTVLDVERANARCMAAIEQQKILVRAAEQD